MKNNPPQPKDPPAPADDSSADLDSPSTAPANKEEELEIIVKALEEVRVHYQVDQGEKQSSLLAEDQFKVLKGKKNIFIKTKHSDLIYIFHNGKDLGLFGSGGKKEQSFSLTEPSKTKGFRMNFIAMDVETTGTLSYVDHIVELAAVRWTLKKSGTLFLL